MIEIGSMTSRRALLGALTVAPIAALPDRAEASPWGAAIGVLPYASTDQPVLLQRSRKGRNDSRFRYHNAESFFVGIEGGIVRHPHDRLYQTGIVLQLGLSSHLLDVGFTDLVRFRVRRDTAADWTAANPTLQLGEPGLETNTRRVKYGDGATAWNALAYSTAVVVWGGIGGALADQLDLKAALDAKQPLNGNLTAFAAKTAPAGTVVGTSDVQTLTNRRLARRRYRAAARSMPRDI